MTGFGSSERGGFRVDIRSLNHRFMDVNVRIPPALSKCEITLREMLKERFDRGKFDVFVSSPRAGELRLNVDTAVASEIKAALESLREAAGLSEAVELSHLLNWKELFIEQELTYDEDELMGAFAEAVEGLEAMRIKEGDALLADLSSRAGRLKELHLQATEALPAAQAAAREKSTEKLREFLAGMDCDDAKLLREASNAVERDDISEELTRFISHTEHFGELLGGGGTVGRKLDFLLQELNREANTIASKIDDYGIVSIAVEMKAEIEKAKEQVQNLQ